MDITKHFSSFARMVARASGQPTAFVLACAIVVVWLATGSFFEFSDTWQLFINTGTTIVTFFMVFLIQNTQNRDGEAIQIKLDELIRSHPTALKALLDLEELTEDQLRQIKDKYEEIATIARKKLAQERKKT